MSESAKKSNLWLAGMMGTGKTSSGRLVASKLRFVFADTDKLIELREQLTVAQIFASHGEEHFRKCEREILSDLCTQDRQVIATGGGMLANSGNLEVARANGLVVFLYASPSELAHRLRYRNDRPLLNDADPTQRIAELEAKRREVFDQITHRIDTSGKTPLQTSEAVLETFLNWLQS